MKQLKMLLDYTKFHIGFYLTFAGIAVALVQLKIVKLAVLVPSFVGLLAAGIAGGVIGSSIPLYDSFDGFKKDELGFWGIRIMPFEQWARLEHLGFWFAILWGIGAILLTDPGTVDAALQKSTK
jgi:hypothetical protein